MSRQTELVRQHVLKAEVITPLHVGSSDVISPLFDYVLQGREIHLLDKTKLRTEIYESKLTDLFSDQIKQVADVNKAEFLPRFIQKEMKRDWRDFKSEYPAIPVNGVNNPVEIKCCLKSCGYPYMPGSTLKGVIMSAIIYDWLRDSEQQYTLDLRWSGRWEPYSGTPGNLFRSWFELAEKPKTETRDITDNFQRIVKLLFQRGEKDLLTDAGLTGISDSRQLQKPSLEITAASRYFLDKEVNSSKTAAIELLLETVQPQTVFQDIVLTVQHNPLLELKNRDMKMLNEDNLNTLFQIISNYSYNQLYHEQIELDYAIGTAQRTLGDYKLFVDSLMEIISKDLDAVPGETAWLRIGQGKTFFHNTVMILLRAFYEGDEIYEKMEAYRNKFKLGVDDSDFFPRTRLLTNTGQLPLGWIKLTA